MVYSILHQTMYHSALYLEWLVFCQVGVLSWPRSTPLRNIGRVVARVPRPKKAGSDRRASGSAARGRGKCLAFSRPFRGRA